MAEGLEEVDLELTAAQKDLLLKRLEQVERGDVIEGEEVMARFAEVLKEIAAR